MIYLQIIIWRFLEEWLFLLLHGLSSADCWLAYGEDGIRLLLEVHSEKGKGDHTENTVFIGSADWILRYLFQVVWCYMLE